MLDLTDKKYASYLECRFGSGYRSDCAKEIECLADKISSEEMSELKTFDRKTDGVYHLISRDEEEYVSKAELDSLTEYEKLADTMRISPQHKVTMYEYVLLGCDKFDRSNTHALQLIDKMVDNTEKDKTKLQRYGDRIKSYRYCQDAKIYYNLEKKIADKLRGRKVPTSEKKEETLAEFNRLKSNIASPMFSADEKLKMLQKQLEIEKYCGFGRAKFYFVQSDIYTKMANIYSCQHDDFRSEECRAKSDDSLYLANNIMRHAKKKGGAGQNTFKNEKKR